MPCHCVCESVKTQIVTFNEALQNTVLLGIGNTEVAACRMYDSRNIGGIHRLMLCVLHQCDDLRELFFIGCRTDSFLQLGQKSAVCFGQGFL